MDEISKSITLGETGNIITFIYTKEDPIISDGSWNGTVNTPKLSAGMKPVAWGNSYNEITPTTNNEWYSYIAQTATTENGGTSRWANAKAVNGSNEAYFVWIPRYEYKIVSGYHISTAGEIDIKFIQTSQTVADSGYTIHPAFNFGGKELDGIWVGKYEVAGTTSAVNIKPDVQSLTSINVSTMFTASRGVSTTYGLTGDTHMMKNTEWGAVVYLAHSKYGRNGTEVTINNSSSYYTGRAGGSISASSTAAGTYKYNTSGGVLASTTGNIYGIYDMSGGSWEYVMGVYNNTIGSSGFVALPESKYYDNYTGYSASYIGDAMYETSSSSSGSTSWFQDDSHFVSASSPWLTRGGIYFNGTRAGLFSFIFSGGTASSNLGFRAVLTL